MSSGTFSVSYLPFEYHVIDYLRNHDRATSVVCGIVLLVERLEAVILGHDATAAGLEACLRSCPLDLLDDRCTSFLLFLSIDRALSLPKIAQDPDLSSTLRTWWVIHKRYKDCTADVIMEALYHTHITPVGSLSPALANLDLGVRSALGFALVQRRCISQAKTVLEGCLTCAGNLWPVDSPTLSLLLAETVNCENTLGSESPGLVHAAQALMNAVERSSACRFDIKCLQFALVDSHIGHREYAAAEKLLLSVVADTEISDEMLCCANLRLSKVKRRLARKEATSLVDLEWFKELVPRLEIVSAPSKLECLEEVCCTVVETKQPASLVRAVVGSIYDNVVLNSHSSGGQENWRVAVIESALESAVSSYVIWQYHVERASS